MKGYKCDNCGQWFENSPFSEHFGTYVGTGIGQTLNATHIHLEVYKNGCAKEQDLCPNCSIQEVRLMIELKEKELKSKSEVKND